MKIGNNIFYTEVGALEVNCTIVKCPETSHIAIFDPGDDFEKIVKMIESAGGIPEYIINTHCHYDHIGAVDQLRRKYNIPFLVHTEEKEYALDPEKNYSVMTEQKLKINPDGLFSDGDIFNLGKIGIKTIHTPGHTKGSCCFLTGNVLISGDTLFAGSVGRTDLYGGDTDSLIESIKNKILILDENTLIIPGHGRNTTIKEEKHFNPYL